MSNKPSRTRLSSEGRRAQLLRVATRLLAEGGVGNLSMSAVAQEAGIGRALLYHYFPGKEALVEAVLAEESRRLLEATEPAVGLSPREAARRALDAYFQAFDASSGGIRELYAPTADTVAGVHVITAANHDVQLRRIIELTGVPDTAETRVLIGGWLALVEHLATTRRHAPGADRGELIERCLAALEAVLDRPLPQRSSLPPTSEPGPRV